MAKILFVVGARPEFIQAKPVREAIRSIDSIDEVFVNTGQHYDYEMSKIFYEQLRLSDPDYNLEVGSGSHATQTALMLRRLELVMESEKPDIVLVFGDTNTTIAGSLAAAKLNIPVAHIESGLRSFKKSMPEEINRVVTDHISTLLFAPTNASINNLRREGIEKNVFLTGDVMYDVALSIENVARSESKKVFQKFGIREKEYCVATIHRAENTEDPKRIKNILKGFSLINRKIIFPIHPRTTKFISNHGLNAEVPKNVIISDPLSYIEMACLVIHSRVVLTDSGGLQKEAYFHSVPCITLRDTTEWIELVDSGWNVLVDDNPELIAEKAESLAPQTHRPQFYGEGDASLKIAKILKSYLGI